MSDNRLRYIAAAFPPNPDRARHVACAGRRFASKGTKNRKKYQHKVWILDKKMYFCALNRRKIKTKITTMAKIQNAANSTEESIGIAMSRTELFFEKNGKALTLGLIVLVLLGGLWVGYRNLVSKPRHEKAAELLAQAQNKFEADDADYTVALNGDDNGAGFLEVIERYGSTPAGNLAKHYAGICYLKEGDLKNAAAYLAKYTPVKGIPGSVVNAQNYGLQGDIAVDEGNYKEAVKFFEKAVEAADNNATAPIFLMKAGRAYKALGDTAKAKECFERIATAYPSSFEARDIEKYINSL